MVFLKRKKYRRKLDKNVKNRGIRKLIPKRGERYIQWAVPLYENKAKGTFLFQDNYRIHLPGFTFAWNSRSLAE